MITLFAALTGFAILDSLDVLLIGLTAAIAYDARMRRRSPLRTGSAFLGGVFAATTAFGILAVLGIDFLSRIVDFELTLTVRYWGEAAVGATLIVLACVPRSSRPPPAWTARFRASAPLLATTGFAIGIVQAPTAVPYLAGLAMISASDPLPAAWPVVIVLYCLLAPGIPAAVLALSMGRSPSARRRYRSVVRALTAYGPAAVRVVFAVIGSVLVIDALVHHTHLW
ncbi:hypothetical protein CH293_21270 [Rhodococcus sp. 14-2470-1b]|uniref:GAP family protein n=1 Tax=Rhodococcus sp. 14-2470-1b TaxID=2023149 RepID=UPI000B9BCB9C|nr:GAP family protein [Rhodococcus sp. 14-2470-1b]OZF46062.1 hypothetical protein CH293_21270 [Rhodococcus sp. 14-2470-1b]